MITQTVVHIEGIGLTLCRNRSEAEEYATGMTKLGKTCRVVKLVEEVSQEELDEAKKFIKGLQARISELETELADLKYDKSKE